MNSLMILIMCDGDCSVVRSLPVKDTTAIEQGFSNWGMLTTSGTPATVQWYTG